MPNYQLTSSGTCTNNVCAQTGCMACSSNGQCSACLVGYQFNSTSKSCQVAGYGCNDQNCQFCSGPQSCGQCKPGYQIGNYPATGSINSVRLCRPLICPYNVTNCMSCSLSYDSNFNFQKTLCSACNSGFILVNGYCVANLVAPTCSVSNCNSCSYNNFCKLCNSGFSLTSYGTCVPTQCTVANCASCSLNYICQQCNTNYTLALSPLQLTSATAYGFASWALTQQCVPNTVSCNVANCAYCLSANQCASCATGYDFSASNSNLCVASCNVANCFQCTEGNANNCTTCSPGFQSQSSGASCQAIPVNCGSGCANSSCIYNWVTAQPECTACQSSLTLYKGVCYQSTCNIYGCSVCANWASPFYCITCNQGLILTNGYCSKTNCNNGVANCITCIQTGPCTGCA